MNIKSLINNYTKCGYNSAQAKSLAWADVFEEKMYLMSLKTNSFFGPEIRIDCHCWDCNDGGQFLPDTTKSFIIRHKNHNTKTIKLR